MHSMMPKPAHSLESPYPTILVRLKWNVPALLASCSSFLSIVAFGQTNYPDHLVQGETWTDGVHHIAVTQKVLSPGDVHYPMNIAGTAHAEFTSGTRVHLAPGFHAGGFTGTGEFHVYIDDALGPDGDVVAIAPDPATHIIGNVLHVNKWEKLEIGLQLPQDYQDAIDRFFNHYYADPVDPFVATPDDVDPAHDLNPYADDSLQVVLTLTKPDGSKTLKWGYFMREAKWNGTARTSLLVEDPANPLHPYHIRFRMAPDMEGTWRFKVSLAAPGVRTLANVQLAPYEYTGYAFVCDQPLPDNHGALRVNEANRRTLRFEDGTPYFGLGTNFSVVAGHGNGWWDMDDYRLTRESFTEAGDALEALRSVGGNFVRIFLGNRTFSPEYVHLGVYDRYVESLGCNPGDIPIGKGSYQNNCWALDQLVNHARTTGTYLQACVKPYPPITAYETWGWHNDAYLSNFVEPRNPLTSMYDMKRYFYTNGDPATAQDSGSAFYYWKRRYKYIMNRWGYSVNIPIIEPFNEIDQTLTYQDVTATELCPENNIHWAKDDSLPGLISQWISDIAQFVRGDVDLNDPTSSPLGYDKKLFLMSYAMSDPNMADGSNFYAPFLNPDVDLIDAHRGMYSGEHELSNSFDHSQDFRNNYASTTNGVTNTKPFHQGESNYYQSVDIATYEGNDTVPNVKEAAAYFDNYDVSFHNELWASTFFGNFAAASTWHKERVFWWIRDEEKGRPIFDNNNPFYFDYPRTAALGGVNALKIPSDSLPILVQNRTLYHHFKPLSDFLGVVATEPGGFFDQAHEPRKVYDDTGEIECYYLLNETQNMAVGWVHNLNAHWENHYYVLNQKQNYLGCTSPNAQSVALPGLQPGMDYHVSWFPTRMDMIDLPTDHDDTTQTGTVVLDFSTLPFNGIYSWPPNDNLDTLRSDYAFLIQPKMELRMVPNSLAESPSSVPWDFSLYPNPTTGRLHVLLPPGPPMELAAMDASGRQLLHLYDLSEGMHQLDLSKLSPGAYGVRVTVDKQTRTKLLIKH